EAGAAELVTLSHEMMMNLAALISGVDRPRRTTEESLHLYRYLMKFIEGATLAHSTRDRAEVSAEVLAALEAWDGEFLTPSIALRRAALDRLAAGTIGEGELPKDVLTVLLRNQDNLHLPHEVLRREIAFFLLAGAHTSATAFTRSIDRIFAQRCVHETIRLNPSSPVGMRWAEAEIPLGDGRTARPGDKVVIDLMAVNRDPAVFGADGGEFNPERKLPDGVAPYGLSFGTGMHACIGQDLSGGLVPDPDGTAAGEHLYGLVAVAVQAMFDRGVAPDP